MKKKKKKPTLADLRRKNSERFKKKTGGLVTGFNVTRKRATVYSLIKLYHALKQDNDLDAIVKAHENKMKGGGASQKSGYTLDDSPQLWWLYWKDMHENVLKGRLKRMRRCFLERFPTKDVDAEDENMEKFNKYLNRIIQGTPEENFGDSLLSTDSEKREDRGNSMIRDLILQNMCLHFEAAEADHECLQIAEDWFEWEKSLWRSTDDDDDDDDDNDDVDISKKLSHVALLEKMISEKEEKSLFHSSTNSTTTNNKTQKEAETTKKNRNSVNILCRDLLKELMKAHTKGKIDPKLWKEYGGGEPWTESLRDFSLRQHLNTFRGMHETENKEEGARRRNKLLERCGSSEKTRGSLLTHQSIEEINTLWERVKILANKIYAFKKGSRTARGISSHDPTVEVVKKDIVRAQYLRDVHQKHSAVSKVAEMYLSFARMTLDANTKMSEMHRAMKNKAKYSVAEEEKGEEDDDDDDDDCNDESDEDYDENDVFDIQAMAKTYRFSEDTIKKFKQRFASSEEDFEEDDEDDGHECRRRETMMYIPHGRKYDEL